MGLGSVATSLSDRIGAFGSALSGWMPRWLIDGVPWPDRWGEYAPLEFFFGLVLIVGVVLLICGVLGIVHALALRLTARRVEALAGMARASPDTRRQGLLAAFRASPRLQRLGRSYADELRMVRDAAQGTVLAAPRRASEALPAAALAAGVSRLRSDRLLGTIVGLGGVVILIELGVGLLRLHAELSQSRGPRGIDALLDPAMSGAIFALGCVLLTALSVGAHRLILRLLHANVVRLQAALDALFFRPDEAAATDEPKFVWPASTVVPPSARLTAPRVTEGGRLAAERPIAAASADKGFAASPIGEARAAPAAMKETGGGAREPEPVEDGLETDRSRGLAGLEAAAEEIRLLVAKLGEDRSSRQAALDEILSQMQTPAAAEAARAAELAQLRESAAELALLAEATRESITQLAAITGNLSRAVASLVARADAGSADAPPAPHAAAPAVLGELRELMQEIDQADLPERNPDTYETEAASRG